MKIDLSQPLEAVAGQAAPMILRIVTRPRRDEMVGGVPATNAKVAEYVLYSALPEEIKQRVKLAVEAIMAAG